MMNQTKTLLLLLLVSFSMLAVGCGGDQEEAKAPVVNKRTVAPPKPVEKTIEQLTEMLNVDDRIILDESESPTSESQRTAMLKFFNAMIHADEQTLRNMLSFSDQLELKAMIDSGFADQMDEVSLLMLKTGTDPDGVACVMAIYEIGHDYQVQMWFIESTDNSIVFSAAETPPNLVDQLSGNWVDNYFVLQKKQEQVALQPDEDTSYTLAGELTSTDGSLGEDGGDSPGKPGGPGGPPGRPGGPPGR